MSRMTLNELNEHIDKVAKEYKGDIVLLSDAIGAARLGYLYGWRVMRIVTNPRTYVRHQKILGLSFKEVLPETTEYSSKSAGYNLVLKLGKFWEVVNGIIPIDKNEKTLAI